MGDSQKCYEYENVDITNNISQELNTLILDCNNYWFTNIIGIGDENLLRVSPALEKLDEIFFSENESSKKV